MNQMITAIDPGTDQSAILKFDGKKVWDAEMLPNTELLNRVRQGRFVNLAVEMIASYGMPVGRETFETVLLIGRIMEAQRTYWGGAGQGETRLVYRKDVKMWLCGSMKAKDGNLKQALVDRHGGDSVAVGGIKCLSCKGRGKFGRDKTSCPQCAATGWSHPPGPFHKLVSHLWQALALADYALNNPEI